MLYGNESISSYSRSNVSVWMAMAFQAGLVNMGGFMACHRFVSHVTGFATFFGAEVHQAESRHASGMLVVPLFFLFGAMLSGLFVDLRLKQHKKPKYYISFSIMFALYAFVYAGGMLDWFGPFGEPLVHSRDYLLLILLCTACGVQNGTITTVSRSVIRTTHLTGITTDLGIGLVRWWNREKFPEEAANEGRANLMRAGIIVSFVLGSVAGYPIFARWGYGGFLVPLCTSGALLATMIGFQLTRGRS